jgi:hypothetical protein
MDRLVVKLKELKPGDKFKPIPDDGSGFSKVIQSNGDEYIWVVKFTSPRVSQSPRKASNISVFVMDRGVVNFSDLKPGDKFRFIPDDGVDREAFESRVAEYPYLFYAEAPDTPVFAIKRQR